jgi:cell division protein FtsA
MATTEFIAAIELGSSKITGVAGKRNSDGSMQILAYAQEDSTSVIHKGVVYNLDKTAQCLTSIINRLESDLNSHIARVYVGISGKSLRTIQNVIVRDLDEVTTISQELVDAIRDENIEIPVVDMDILEVIPQEYKVDNYNQTDPVGVACSHIEGHFLNIVARSLVKKNLEKSFEQAKIEIADLVISPLATAKLVLNETERRSGCALIDLGAETTTVSVYKNNLLRYLAVIPLGGNAITHDLTTLQIEEEEAERLKLTYGNALYEEEPSETPATVLLDDGTRTVELAHLNEIVGARLEEIIANVWNQLQLSGYADKLLSGLILTGGASNMKNIDATFRKQCKIEKIRFARTGRLTVFADGDILRKDSTQNGILGILFEGRDNCWEKEEPKPAQQAQTTKTVVQPAQETKKEEKNLFDVDEELRKQAEAEKEARRLKEEEERQRKEEEKRLEKQRKEEEKRRKEEERRKKKGPSLWDKLGNFSKDIFSDDGLN